MDGLTATAVRFDVRGTSKRTVRKHNPERRPTLPSASAMRATISVPVLGLARIPIVARPSPLVVRVLGVPRWLPDEISVVNESS